MKRIFSSLIFIFFLPSYSAAGATLGECLEITECACASGICVGAACASCCETDSQMSRTQRAGFAIAAIGAVTTIASGITAGVASYEPYCDPSSTYSREGVIGQRDCGYDVCALSVYNGVTYACSDYYSGSFLGYQRSCTYVRGGYSQCLIWHRVPQSCPIYGCLNPNNQAQTAPYLYRHKEPMRSHALTALYVGAGVFVAGIGTWVLGWILRPPTVTRNPESV